MSMMKFYKDKLFATIMAVALLAGLSMAPAAVAAGCGGNSFFFIEPWTQALPCQGDQPVIDNLRDNVLSLALWAVDSLLTLSAYIAVGFIIWGAIKYIKAQGEPSELASAKNTIAQAIFGLIICIASVAIVQFVSGAF